MMPRTRRGRTRTRCAGRPICPCPRLSQDKEKVRLKTMVKYRLTTTIRRGLKWRELDIAASGDFQMTASRSADKGRPGNTLPDPMPHSWTPALGVPRAMHRRRLAQPLQEMRREASSRASVEVARGRRIRLNARKKTAVA